MIRGRSLRGRRIVRLAGLRLSAALWRGKRGAARTAAPFAAKTAAAFKTGAAKTKTVLLFVFNAAISPLPGKAAATFKTCAAKAGARVRPAVSEAVSAIRLVCIVVTVTAAPPVANAALLLRSGFLKAALLVRSGFLKAALPVRSGFLKAAVPVRSGFLKAALPVRSGFLTIAVPVRSGLWNAASRTVSFVNRIDKRVYAGAGACCAVVAVCLLVAQALTAPNVWSVSLDGRDVGYVLDEAAFETVLAEAKQGIIDNETSINVSVDISQVACAESDVKERDVTFLSSAELADQLIAAGSCTADIWTVRINGQQVAATTTKAEAERILEQVKDSYLNSDSEMLEATIKETVEVAKQSVDLDEADDVSDVDSAVNYILTGTKEPKVYTVQAGDNPWNIARANNISLEELEQANPEMNPERINVGQQLNLYEVKPFLTIRTVELASKDESIAFSTVYENSADMYKGQTRVVTPGVPGNRAVQTQITKENGIVVDSVEIGSAITAEPQTQVAAVGTKPIATFTGTGSLISPLARIEVSSAYGSRGSRRHEGVDMRSPKGTPIYAADDGVVTTSQYKGSYGNLIVLSHGGGMETYYAHCDSLLVHVGDVVNQGQTIATVGITGNATGYHLHFEVRMNGIYQNPMNYF
ncbi:MAG: peptidoglycan DD-metalloendopeptidase family protein [Clostridiales Family XIII bacterium]|nr:peptidoglycan DD-metalloendopeptidase family protein [Clostridiales Family XIII bacterium]